MEPKKLNVLPRGAVCTSQKMAAIHLTKLADEAPRFPKVIRQYTRKRKQNTETITSPKTPTLIDSERICVNGFDDTVKVKQEIECEIELSKPDRTTELSNEQSSTSFFIKKEPIDTIEVTVKTEWTPDILGENAEAKSSCESVEIHVPKIKAENIEGNSCVKILNGIFSQDHADSNFMELLKNDKILLTEEIDIKEESDCEIKSELSSDTGELETGDTFEYKSDIIECDADTKANAKCTVLKKCVPKEIDIANAPWQLKDKTLKILPYELSCDRCLLQFDSKSSMQSHMRIHLRRFKCSVCLAKFRYNYRLVSHMRSHTGKSLKCELCDKVYKHPETFAYHLNTHLLEQLFFCPICQSSFTSRESLYAHIPIHTGTEEFKCELCEQTFAYKSELNKHASAHSEFPCEICGEHFKQQSSLLRHEKVHLKVHECAFCPKLYPSFSTMQAHMMLHVNEITKKGLKWINFRTKYKCKFCEKLFQYRSTLAAHERCHTNERPFPCSVCKKSFKTVSALNGHVKKHSKPFSCDVCGKKYGRKDILVRHLRQHTGEKPYGCLLCDSFFTQQTSLVYHTKRFHGDGGTKRERAKSKATRRERKKKK